MYLNGIGCSLKIHRFISFPTPFIENREVLEKKTITTEIGSSETIRCSLKKNDTKNIRWYDSLERLLRNTTNKLERKIEVSGKTLTLNDIALSDGGTYQCRGLSYVRVYTIYVTGRLSFLSLLVGNF